VEKNLRDLQRQLARLGKNCEKENSLRINAKRGKRFIQK
jgi:hypothetical protein